MNNSIHFSSTKGQKRAKPVRKKHFQLPSKVGHEVENGGEIAGLVEDQPWNFPQIVLGSIAKELEVSSLGIAPVAGAELGDVMPRQQWVTRTANTR